MMFAPMPYPIQADKMREVLLADPQPLIAALGRWPVVVAAICDLVVCETDEEFKQVMRKHFGADDTLLHPIEAHYISLVVGRAWQAVGGSPKVWRARQSAFLN